MEIDDEALAPFRAVGRGRPSVADHAAVRAAVAGEAPLASPYNGRVLLAGDWHGNTAHAVDVLRFAKRLHAPTVLQLGDFGFSADGEGHLDVLSATAEALGLTLLVVDGNHEDFPFLQRFPVLPDGPGRGLRPVRPRLWHLPRGTRWTWAEPDRTTGRWVAVGGAASVDRALRTEGYSWWPSEELTSREAAEITAAGPVDVVVCHDRPQAAAIALGDRPGEWWSDAPQAWAEVDLARSDAHSARVQQVVDAVRPRHVWHGHLHRRTDSVLEPAAWGGTCTVHGLAMDGTPMSRCTAVVGVDGRPLEQPADR
jgi:hypothetical protein